MTKDYGSFNWDAPLADAKREAEAQEYARNFKCSMAKARYDVHSEYTTADTTVDNFYARQEARFGEYEGDY